MSQQTQIFEHPQEQSKVVGKIGATNHIIKVHILSNTRNLAGHTYRYDDVKSIPDSFLNELVGLPTPKEHNHRELTPLYTKLEKEGRTDCEIRRALIDKSGEHSVGIVDDVYKPVKISFNSAAIIPEVDLYGTIEVTDPMENQYIEQHGEPSHRFTSISTFGPYVVDEGNGVIYNDLGKVRPFELALVKDPAFGKNKAMVRGVCRDDKTTCRNRLAYASVIENINTDSNDINNMSNKNQVEQVPATAAVETPVTAAVVKDIPAPVQPDETTPEKAPVVDIKKPEKEEQSAPSSASSSSTTGNNKEIDELRAQLEKQAKEIEERKRTYRSDLLAFTLDPKAFKSEEELNTEKQNVMTIFEKYNFSDDHAKWLVTKAFPRITSPAPVADGSKKTTTAAVYNSLSYNPSDHIKSVSNDPAPQYNSNKKQDKRIELVELEY